MEIIILAVIFVLFAFFVMEFYNVFFKGFAPFISTKSKTVKKIVAEMNISENAEVIELGCGSAGFLKAVRKKFPKAKLIGVERAIVPYFVAGIQNAFCKTGIKITRKDIFQVDLSGADLIYCYLNAQTMKKLEEKFIEECKTGAQIISFVFPLKNMQEIKKYGTEKKNREIFFYKVV